MCIRDRIRLSDGRIVGKDHIFKDGDDCVFSVDAPQEPVDWTFVMKTVDGHDPKKYNPRKTLSKSSTQAKLHLKDVIREPWGWYIKVFKAEDDPRKVYNKGTVYISKNGEQLDSMEITFDVLPLLPKVISGNMVGDFNYETGHFIKSMFTFQVHCPRATSMWGLLDFCYWDDPLPEPESFMVSSIYPHNLDGTDDDATPFGDSGDEIWTIVDTTLTVNAFIVLLTFNDYGICQSAYNCDARWENRYVGDTIRVYDYITDPDIIACLERLRDEETSGQPVLEDDTSNSQLCINKNILSFPGEDNDVEQIFVTNPMGIIVKESRGSASLNISDLRQGVYVATLTTKKKQKITQKFVIR